VKKLKTQLKKDNYMEKKKIEEKFKRRKEGRKKNFEECIKYEYLRVFLKKQTQ